MSRIITIDKSKENQLIGIKKSVEVMALTIGPRGGNVSLSNGIVVNDGKQVIDDVEFKNKQHEKGARRVKNLVRAISEDVGGGRTAGAILFKELVSNGVKLLNKGYNGNFIKSGMIQASKDISVALDSLAKPVKGIKDLERVATISTEDPEMAKVIAETIHKIGKDGIVTVEEGNSFGITAQIEDGLKCNQGYMSSYMVTDRERMEAEYEDIAVMITDKKISVFKDLVPVMESLSKKGKKDLFLIAEDIDESVLRIINTNKVAGVFNILAIKTPGVGDLKKLTTEDLCALTGATLLTEQNWNSFVEMKPTETPLGTMQIPYLDTQVLGQARKVLSKKDSTVVFGKGDIQSWIETLKTRRDSCETKWEKDQYDERIAKLSNGIAVIKVGSSSPDEIKYLKLKVEDGVNETKRALEEGIVVGGDTAYLHVLRALKTPSSLNKEQLLGYQLVLDSLSAPLRQIVLNSNDKPDVIEHGILNSEYPAGYDAIERKIVPDMIKEGIIDAVKVTKTVLQYAVKEAGLFLTISGDISEEVKID